VASFAGDDKRVQAGSRGVEHGFSIGEYKAKISTGQKGLRIGTTSVEQSQPYRSRLKCKNLCASNR
jgi:hypothetical protein